MLLPSGTVQLPPINSSYRYLRSGPILILNQSTFYITSLRYDGKLNNAFVVARNISTGLFLVLPEENSFTDNLHPHWGQNVYLTLRNNVTIYDVDYVSVWSKRDERDYGKISIPKGIKLPENPNQQENVSATLI